MNEKMTILEMKASCGLWFGRSENDILATVTNRNFPKST
jgi:hypothetical protein